MIRQFNVIYYFPEKLDESLILIYFILDNISTYFIKHEFTIFMCVIRQT